MNILYLTNHLNIGGITSYVLTLAQGLTKRGHNIYLASSGGAMREIFAQAGVTFIPIPIRTKKEISLKILWSKLKLSHLFARYNFELIHANSRTTQVLASLLSRSLNIPYVTTCHGFFKMRILRRIFPCWGCKTIAISEQVKEHLLRDFKVDEKNIALVYNGIDVARFRLQTTDYRLQARQELGLGDGPVIGIVARLSDVKGHRYLIEAMPQVLINHRQSGTQSGKCLPEAQLLIVGDGREKDKLAGLVNNLGLEESVKFIPEVSDTRQVLAAMDVFIMPSLKEGLGLSLMEAMAAGIAVIGSDVGGIRDLIRDGVTGILVKPADAYAISQAIIGLLQDTKKREALGGSAQMFIAQNFSQDKMVRETERIYLECANLRR